MEWALRSIAERGAEIAGVLFVGGTAKIEDPRSALGRIAPAARVFAERTGELETVLVDAIGSSRAEVVVDLSDAPVLGYPLRYRLVSGALYEGVPNAGADFAFDPPQRARVFSKPSIGIIGSGKRVGKTASAIHVARVLRAARWAPITVTMARGGPREPEVIGPTGGNPVDRLLRVAADGKHAASDYWEDAVLSDVPTIGCSRYGGGLFGSPFDSNVAEGARIAEEAPEDIVFVEVSGPTLPPVETDVTVLVCGAASSPYEAFTGLARYRLLRADCIVSTGCEPPFADADAIERIDRFIRSEKADMPVFHTVRVLEPLGDISGQGVLSATTTDGEGAARMSRSLEDRHRCRVEYTSTKLGDREGLRDDMSAGLSQCDVLPTETKAASIDVAAQTAREHGVPVVLLHNSPRVRSGEDLDDFVAQPVGRRNGTRS